MRAARSRLVTAGLAAACTAQLAVAGVVVAHRWGEDDGAVDVLRTLETSPTTTPTIAPSPAATSTPSGGVESPGVDVLSPSAPALLTSSVSPVPGRPTEQPRSLSHCGDVAYTEAPAPVTGFEVERSGEDAGPVVVDGGAAYFTETKRDGSFDTRLVRVDLTTGEERHSVRDAYFNLTDAAAGHGWGVDRNGVAEIDSVAGKVVRRWATSAFPVDGADGLYNQPGLVSVDGASAYVFGFDGPEVALSRVDVVSGDVRWTIPLPVEGVGTGYSRGPRTIVDAYGGAAYVALPLHLSKRDVLRVWRVSASGEVTQRRDVAAPDADANGPSWLAVSEDGVYTSVTTSGGDLDATILRLDLDTLATRASTDVDVLENLAVGPDSVWAVTLQCSTFLWHRLTTGELAPVGHPWSLPDQSYSVAPAGERVWSLRTRDPMEATLVVGYPS